MRDSKKKALVVTPSARGGSWGAIRALMHEAEPSFVFTVVALGTVLKQDRRYRIWRLPYPNYDEGAGRVASSNSVLALIYDLPLLLLSFAALLLYRPSVVMGNGLLVSLAMSIPAKMLGAKVICCHHGYVQFYVGRIAQSVVRMGAKSLDCVVVNSETSREDVATVVPRTRILTVEHWADDIFFSRRDRLACRAEFGVTDKFAVLYVGRIDADKQCGVLLKVVDAIAADPSFAFLFVGVGGLVGDVIDVQAKNANVRYLGYVGDSAKLARLYTCADLVWSYADETYVARPGIEGLASGSPILIPNTPALTKKRARGIVIRDDVIPKSVGWIVDSDPMLIASMLFDIKTRGLAFKMRDDCTEYAKSKHSRRNMAPVIELLGRLSQQ